VVLAFEHHLADRDAGVAILPDRAPDAGRGRHICQRREAAGRCATRDPSSAQASSAEGAAAKPGHQTAEPDLVPGGLSTSGALTMGRKRSTRTFLDELDDELVLNLVSRRDVTDG
jgi:hypothetical protein